MDPWRTIAHLSRKEIKELQNRKLHHIINTYVYPFSPFYRRMFDQNKINPRAIKTVEDLKHIPPVAKTNFLATPDAPDKFKEFILQPDKEKIRSAWPMSKKLPLVLKTVLRGQEYVQDELSREFRPIFMTFTTGTTHRPVPFMYSRYDIDNLCVSGARMVALFDVKNSERLFSMFPYAPHLAFWQVFFGGIASGVLTINTGGGKVMGTEGNIAALLKMQPSVILGVPSYVYHVLRLAAQRKCKMDFIKKIVLGAARITQGFKLKLAELVESMGGSHVSVFGTYGFTEARSAWAECPTGNDTSSGYHLYPDKEVIEIIDPKTGEVKGEGEDGEIVYSGLDARGSVVLRYRTGDFVKGGITYAPCPHCGRTVPRISSDITRLSDVKDLRLSKIKGALVNLNAFEAVLSDIPAIDEWQVELRKKDNDPFEIDEVMVNICVRDGYNKEQVEAEIKNKLQSSTEITPNEIRFVSLHEMVQRLELEVSNKEKRVIDHRPKE